MRIIAFYLPQFHEIPENNEMWGKGFTEWTNVKKAEPMFEGHLQPRVPLNDNYYDLTNTDVMKWQVDIAKEHGVYGFCFYHYWFSGHMLLEKPVDNYLADKSLDLPFCICWANHSWTDSWKSKNDTVKIEQKYGDQKEWKQHFEYFLPFFKDKRYIRNDDKPLLVIYQGVRVECLNEMLDYWQQLAIEAGLPGLDFAYQDVGPELYQNWDHSRFRYNIEYQPQYARFLAYKQGKPKMLGLRHLFTKINEKYLKIDTSHLKKDKLQTYDYDDLWQHVLGMGPVNEKSVPGAFVNVDTTPRRHERGICNTGMTPEKFEKYLTQQIVRARDVYHQDMMFMFAWNEWAEGGFMEPDKDFGYGVLEAIKNSLENTGEFPAYPSNEEENCK